MGSETGEFKSVYKSYESRWSRWENKQIKSGALGKLLTMHVHFNDGTEYNQPINKSQRKAVRKSQGLYVADTI